MNVLDMLSGALSGQSQQTRQVADQIGATPEQTSSAMQAAVPMILQALHQNTQQGGEAALGQALQNHDGSTLDQFQQGQLPDTGEGQRIVQHAFGSNADAAAQSLASRSGLDAGSAMQILATVAPLVLSLLGRGQDQGQASGAGGLGGMLGGLLSSLGGAGGLGGMLGSVLGGQGGTAGSTGGLGGMLGGMLGGQQQAGQGSPAQGGSQQGGLGGMLGSVLGGAGAGGLGGMLGGMLGGQEQGGQESQEQNRAQTRQQEQDTPQDGAQDDSGSLSDLAGSAERETGGER